jgi:hypothetical protein
MMFSVKTNTNTNTRTSLVVAAALLLLLVISLPTVSFAFGVTSNSSRQPSTTLTTTTTTTALFFEPTTIGIALVSAAAGAAAQVPKIQALEKELDTTRAALSASEEEMLDKMTKLEDQLFNMDEEFEMQTTKFQKQYDRQKQVELERITDKLKVDLQYKLEIKLQEERSKLLGQQLVELNGNGISDKQGELSTLRLQQSQIAQANLKLEQALQESTKELDKMRSFQTKKFFGLF